MRKRRVTQMATALVGCVLVAAVVATPARADPIQITSGALIWPDVRIVLQGSGFTFEGVTSPFDGFVPRDCVTTPVCVAGSTVQLRAGWSGNSLSGTATLDGRTFTSVGSLSADSSINIQWNGALSIPEGFDGGELAAPFTFAGSFFFEEDPTQAWTRQDLIGTGTATLTFVPWSVPEFADAFFVSSAAYTFDGPAPTPEPTSFFLFATGLAGVIWRRRAAKVTSRPLGDNVQLVGSR